MHKLVVILGPTASGKTELSIQLAKKFNGEVVSADSRQAYRGMDIGSGKITKKETRGIRHHLLDVANPKRKFTVNHFQKLALKAIADIQKKGKTPFLVGGTGFYIQSVVDGIVIPEIKPDWKLRKELEKKSNEELFNQLKKLDPKRAGAIDKHNPRRLIRALEIVIKTGKPVPSQGRHCDEQAARVVKQFMARAQTLDCHGSAEPCNDKKRILQIGIKKSQEELKKAIRKRLLKRLENNAMINEVKKLHKSGLSWKRLEEFGLEYRFTAQYLQGKILYEEMINKIQKESERFAKRQMTWFKRDKRIIWVSSYASAKEYLVKFLKES